MAQKVLDPKYAKINETTKHWRQGDCMLGEHEFMFVPNPQNHIATSETLNGDEDVIVQEVSGLCVVSQTCDIVRCCSDRPYIEVSPLVEVAETKMAEIEKGERPNYGFLPKLKGRKFAVDLDRVMTLEKSCLEDIERVEGCGSDGERRSFSKALSRKRMRFAFPNEFNKLASKLRGRIIEKHDKQSSEGEALRSLEEIRVCAAPSWQDNEIDLYFYFIRKPEERSFKGTSWEELLKIWMGLLKEDERFKNIGGEVTTLEVLSAQEYVDSDQLDLDHLSF